MVVDLVGKRVLVLSDNDVLSRAIELNLNHNLAVEVIRFALSSPGQRGDQAEIEDCDLIIATILLPARGPEVALSRKSLTGRNGEVPLLIISDRSLCSDPDDKIILMDFPFGIDELAHKVREILEGTL